MKKLIFLVGLLGTIGLRAETRERAQVLDYTQVPNMEYSFEIKTSKFDKVILDCQSFITGMNFYNQDKVVHSIYLDAYSDCPNMHNFINESLNAKKPVCLEVEDSTLTVSNDFDCQ